MTNPTNSLARARSPYLRSAMHQPIHWHEWGEEAFAAARKDNKPILLDIGAVWCHWCHVMDRESYEDPDVARLINDNFIAIKVDRDERPDVDSRYQAAVQAISGQGGWPLTAFLTPEGHPFYGGTYFPPNEGMGRPSFRRVLQAIAAAFREKHGEVIESGEAVMNVIGAESLAGRRGDFDPTIVETIVGAAKSMFDAQNGGFGSAPKFPHPALIDLLLDQYTRTGDAEIRNMVVTTLEHMARGGVYDQLAGGFHRYSTDERWIVPHFEKMSYDNSELLKNYIHAWQATGMAFFAEVARDIVRWMDEVLSDREHGGFYGSQDADISLDDDGDYFTWTLAEAREVLDEEELEAAALHYDIGEIGEMSHNRARNVLYQRAGVDEIARRMGADAAHVQALLDSAKRKMYVARRRRRTPYVDQTLYVSWNALCISAYIEAARALDLEDARHFALRSLDRILSQAWNADQRRLDHVLAYAEGTQAASRAENRIPGLLDDYCFTALACLDAYELTADLTYFQFARHVADAMIERFYDATDGGFFDAEPAGGTPAVGALATRRKPFQDAPTPAGNSAATIALLRLHSYTNEAGYREKARRTLEVFAGIVGQFSIFAASYGMAAVWFSRPHVQVIVVGSDAAAAALARTALHPFAANKAVLRLPDNETAPQNLPPALRETVPQLPAVSQSQTIAVLCSDFTCRQPVTDPEALARDLADALTASPRAKQPAAD